MNRRRFLATTATGLTTALAGCNSVSSGGGNGGSLPTYHQNVPAESSGDAGLVYLSVDGLADLGFFDDNTETETPTPTETPTTEATDPSSALVTAPVGGSVFVALFGLGFGLAAYGDLGTRINDQLDPGESETADDLELSSILFVSNATVLTGSFDTEAYTEALPDSFAETESRDGFTVYEGEADGEGEDGGAVAIGEEALVLGGLANDGPESALEGVERVLDARAGEIDRFADRSADAEWTLRTAGSHDFVVVSTEDTEVEGGGDGGQTYDPVAGTPLESLPTSVIASGASVQTSGGEPSGAEADTALTHTGDPVEAADVESAYADSDTDISVSVSEGEASDSQRVHVDGSFTTDRNLV